MLLFGPDASGFLTDRNRDALAIIGAALGLLGLLPLFRDLTKRESQESAPKVALPSQGPIRRYLIPLVLVVSLPVAIVAWFLKGGDVGFFAFGLLYLFGYVLAVAVYLSIFDLLKRHGFSLYAFGTITVALSTLLICFVATIPSFPIDRPDLPKLSFVGALISVTFPLLLGGWAAWVGAIVRQIYKGIRET
jgi:hypothetical protein